MQEFLSSIADTDLSLSLAKKVKCHKFVIDYYISQRDRLGLISYKYAVPTQSQEYFYLENALVVIVFVLIFYVYLKNAVVAGEKMEKLVIPQLLQGISLFLNNK